MVEGEIKVIDGVLISCSLRIAGTLGGSPDENCNFLTAYPISSEIVYCQHHSWKKIGEENGMTIYSRMKDPKEIKI